MKLPSNSREFATWTVSGAALSTILEVTFDDGASWYQMERPTTTTARVLVAGPDTADNPAGTVVLASGRNVVQIRAVDGVELPVRGGGIIEVWNPLG